MDSDGLLIGEVAARSGVSRKALRLYEALGILRPARRTGSGYRRYPADILGLLAFVGRARRLGLTRAEIKAIVELRRAGSAPCIHVRSVLERKAADLEDLLGDLHRILRCWRSTGNGQAAICPHIEAKGGDVTWNGSPSRSAPIAITVRKLSSRATRSASVRPTIRSGSGRRSGTSSST